MWVLLLVLFLGVLIGVQEYRLRAIRNTAKTQAIEYHDVSDEVLAALAEIRAEEEAAKS